MKVWAFRYQEGWGSRLPRTNHYFFFASQPSEERMLEVLNEFFSKQGWKARATKEWFKPHNSGLLVLETMDLLPA